MATTIQIPDFQFAAFYYPELLDALIRYKRQNIPEHTDESPYDPLMQFIRMQALVGHLNNCLVDMVANESTLPTAQLQETVRNMLRLIDYELQSATPAEVDIVMKLSKVFVSSFQLVPPYARVSNEATEDVAQVYFEDVDGLTIERTDQFGAVFSYDESGDTFEEHTDEANSQTTPADDWTPWGVVAPAVKDILYFGHGSVMWNKLGLWFTTVASGITGVWEYYDGEFRKTNPTSVELSGSNLKHDLTSYLGTTPKPGTKIRVQYNETTAYEDVESAWDGSKNYALTSYLGQTSPKYNTGGGSPTADAETYYSVGSDWEELESPTDGTNQLTADGDLEFDLPQSVTANWKKATINDFEGYFLRFRIVEVSTPTKPVFQYGRIDQGDQFVLRSMVQGRINVEAPIGSSDGTGGQEFETAKDNYIEGTMEVLVDGEAWSEVENFLASRSTDKHFEITKGENDRATIVFGDGTKGRIPPVGVGNIEATYRYLAASDADGNVGANTVNQDQTGISYVSSVWNPRPGTGWTIAEGSTEESLEQAKIAGPASLRTKEVALGPDDVEEMAVQFTDDDGVSPISRARAFEEGFGPKSVELVVVASGGNQASAEQIDALELYFNGDKYAHPPVPQRIVANQEVTAVNFTAKVINIEATVYATGVTAATIANRLRQVFQPEALKDDGVTFQWDFGGDVPRSRIIHEIFEASANITKVELTTPSSDVVLNERELPAIGTVSIVISS
jgi:hypothetical protein